MSSSPKYPPSGKSTYCRWLEQEHGFMHFDIDAQMFQGTGVERIWNSIFQPGGTVQPFIHTLRQWLRSVAIDWGFPPELLGVVRDLKDEGVDIWWVQADKVATRHKFSERRVHAVEDFNRQIARIEAIWSGIAELFGTQIILTLDANGKYLPSETIFRRMFGHEKPQQ